LFHTTTSGSTQTVTRSHSISESSSNHMKCCCTADVAQAFACCFCPSRVTQNRLLARGTTDFHRSFCERIRSLTIQRFIIIAICGQQPKDNNNFLTSRSTTGPFNSCTQAVCGSALSSIACLLCYGQHLLHLVLGVSWSRNKADQTFSFVIT
jgi:hypothetical protein